MKKSSRGGNFTFAGNSNREQDSPTWNVVADKDDDDVFCPQIPGNKSLLEDGTYIQAQKGLPISLSPMDNITQNLERCNYVSLCYKIKK